LADGVELLAAPSLPKRIKEQGSLPLLLALRAAALHDAYGTGGKQGTVMAKPS
jgi:hypothetical protein